MRSRKGLTVVKDHNMKARRGQMITNYGPGALFNDVDGRTYMISAASRWKNTQENLITDEPRLKKLLNVDELSLAPQEKEGFAKAIRFPGWYFCRYCKAMRHYKYEEDVIDGCERCNNGGVYKNKRIAMIPLRFLVVCSNGHATDFPFNKWVHQGADPSGHQLKLLQVPGLTGLLGLQIKCETCKASKSMSGALSPNALSDVFPNGCTGDRPWLSDGLSEHKESCEQEPIGIQKGASNLYYPVIRNSIFIPDASSRFSEELRVFVNKHFDTIRVFTQLDEGAEIGLKGYIQIQEFASKMSDDDLAKTIDLVKEYCRFLEEGKDSSIPDGYTLDDLYFEEYKAFLESYGSNKDFNVIRPGIQNYSAIVSDNFNELTLVESLRDTRAYVGFTRVEPLELKAPKEKLKEIVQKAYGNNKQLLVDVVRGEGVFLSFRKEKLDEWLQTKVVKDRLSIYPQQIIDGLKDNYTDPAHFIMAHTFAHMMINEFCMYSGYSTTSIRERIYVNAPEQPFMCGVLIYTAFGDSEGSMGGLVRLGRPGILEGLIQSMLLKASWCSSDPICSEMVPQGPRLRNLAACHNCALLPETSCEHFNSYLDRNLIIQNGIDNKDYGFFNI
jgi:hypothetical protein